MSPAAGPDVFALGILPDDDKIDIAGLFIAQRTGHAGQQEAGAEIGVLVEPLADRQPQPPERDVVGHARPADRTEEDRVELRQPLQRVVRHQRAVGQVVLTAPGKRLGVQPERTGDLGRGVQRLDPFRHDLLADAVARDDSDVIAVHVVILCYATMTRQSAPPPIGGYSSTRFSSPHRRSFQRYGASIYGHDGDLTRRDAQLLQEIGQQQRRVQVQVEPGPFLRVVPVEMSAEMEAHGCVVRQTSCVKRDP